MAILAGVTPSESDKVRHSTLVRENYRPHHHHHDFFHHCYPFHYHPHHLLLPHHPLPRPPPPPHHHHQLQSSFDIVAVDVWYILILIFIIFIIIGYSTSSFDIVAVDVWYNKVLDACEFMENGTSLSSSRCQHNGNCVNGSRSESPGSFSCHCAQGFTGLFCQYSTLITDHIRRFMAYLWPIPSKYYRGADQPVNHLVQW